LKKLIGLPALRNIAERLASFPRVLIHRDFQSQNIIIHSGQPYLIDFQGMRPGLAEYDLASLLYDPYVRLIESERTQLLDFYCEAVHGADPAFREKFQFCAMQRLMQALGAYAYLGLVKKNRAFLAHIPPAMKSLGEVLSQIPGLNPLQELLVTCGARLA
jgi:N-acetylmuramate 1-kinase